MRQITGHAINILDLLYTMVSKLALASEILKGYTRARFNVVPHNPLFKS